MDAKCKASNVLEVFVQHLLPTLVVGFNFQTLDDVKLQLANWIEIVDRITATIYADAVTLGNSSAAASHSNKNIENNKIVSSSSTVAINNKNNGECES